MSKSSNVEWITVHPNGKEHKGQPIPVEEGKTKGEAVKDFIDKHSKKSLDKNIDELKKEVTTEIKDSKTEEKKINEVFDGNLNPVEIISSGTKIKVNKNPLEAKEWFAAKAWEEKRGSKFFRNNIFSIIKETPKAYNCVMGSAFDFIITWIPKSVVQFIENPSEKDETYIADWDKTYQIIKDTKKYWN